MTERERWIVYPLLFLALGAALRDKLIDRTVTRSIVCQELQIVDEEPLGRQPQRVLARIGRATSKATGETSGLFQISGDVEVVDGDLNGMTPPRPLVEIGRAELTTPTHSIVGGKVFVEGLINSKIYLFQGVPFVPTLQPVPGMSLPDVLRAMQQSAQGKQPANPPAAEPRENERQTPPRDAKPKPGPKAAPLPSKASDDNDSSK